MRNLLLTVLFLLGCCQILLAQNLYLPITHPVYEGHEFFMATAADLDGDGTDEVIAQSDLNTTHIFDLSNTGEFTLLQIVDGRGIHPIDMDMDGDLDLVGQNQAGLIWYENQGNNFISDNGTQFYTWSNIFNVIPLDYDNDGDDDLLVSNPSKIRILENNNGNFSLHQTHPNQGFLYNFHAVDMDTDGDLDLTFYASGYYLISYNEAGLYTAADTANHSFALNVGQLTLGDVDGDGFQDYVLNSPNSSYFTVAFNAGDNIDFTDTVQYYFAPDNSGREIELVDIDGDNDLDVFLGTYSETSNNWFENDGSGNLTPVAYPTLFLGDLNLGIFVPVEFDSDSVPEIISVSQLNRRIHSLDFDLNVDSLAIKDHFEHTTNLLNHVIMSDVDQDGDLDVVSIANINQNISWFETDATSGTFEEHLITSYQQVTSTSNIMADFNGDGFPDLLAPTITTDTSYALIYYNQPNTADFSDPVLLMVGQAIYPLAFDFDGDNDMDIGYVSYPETDYFILENTDGLGTFAPPVSVYENDVYGYYYSKSKDVNGDGFEDLFIAGRSYENGELHYRYVYLENNGSGGYLPEEILVDTFGNYYSHVFELADMNEDGHIDFVYKMGIYDGSETTYTIGICYNINGSGNFTQSFEIFSEVIDINDGTAGPIFVDDWDLDGDMDIVPQLGVWLQNEDNTNQFTVKEANPPHWTRPTLVGAEDFDLDGDKDFVFFHINDIFWVQNTSIHKYWLEGNIIADTTLNCASDSSEFGLWDWTVTAENDDYSFAMITDDTGHYWFPIDSGNWVINAVPKSSFWTSCFMDSTVSMPSGGDTISSNFFMQPASDCPFIQWSTAGGIMRPCQMNTISVELCNYGVIQAEDLFLEVVLDSDLTIDTSSLPYFITPDSTLLFDIGSLPMNECINLNFDVFLGCDSVVLFDLNCIQFFLLPNEICEPDSTEWDGSILQVDGYCLGDSVYFSIQNIGASDMTTPRQVRTQIINDDIVMMIDVDDVQLNASEIVEKQYFAQGMGLRLAVDQSIDFPLGNDEASATVPNCDTLSNNVILNWMSNDDGNPFIELFCNPTFASYDPNDKTAIPIGIGEDHEIEKDWDLDYRIRFQNTGNDTAFLVVLRDTISEHLDLSTLELQGSSHPYTYEIRANRELKISFANILLPDSTTNAAGSQGFVKYTIRPYPTLLPGTVIENTAAIYFDFNEPIITNTVFHTITKPIVASSEEIWVCQDTDNPSDTTLVETIDLIEYDSIHFQHVYVIPPSETTELVSVESGNFVGSVQVFSDTTFTESLIGSNGCDSLVHYQVSILTNTISPSFSHVKIAPNPTKDLLWVEGNINGMDQEWVIHSAQGQKIWEQTLGADQKIPPISLQEIPPGVYWLSVRSDEGHGVWKVVKY